MGLGFRIKAAGPSYKTDGILFKTVPTKHCLAIKPFSWSLGHDKGRQGIKTNVLVSLKD